MVKEKGFKMIETSVFNNNIFIHKDSSNFKNFSFLDKYLENHNGFVAGGCFKNILNNERVKDIDIFFRNEVDYEKAVTLFEDLYKHVYTNDKVRAFYDEDKKISLELICSTFGEPDEIISNFDFTITKFAYYAQKVDAEIDVFDSESEEKPEYYIAHHKDFFEHLHLKRLVIDNDELLFPVSTFERSYRYTKYGYNLCRDSKIKLLASIINIHDFDENELSKSLYDGLD